MHGRNRRMGGVMPGRRAPEATRREQLLEAAYRVALRTGIDGVTLRAVAAEAKLSHGLVLFHFKGKDQLIDAVLDRLLTTTAILDASHDGVPPSSARDCLSALLERELDRSARDVHGMRLFFEYWALGVRHAPIRRKIAAALGRYRAAFRSLAAELLVAGPHRADLGPDALAAVAVSLVSGYAVQAMIDPHHLDVDAYRAAALTMIERLGTMPA